MIWSGESELQCTVKPAYNETAKDLKLFALQEVSFSHRYFKFGSSELSWYSAKDRFFYAQVLLKTGLTA